MIDFLLSWALFFIVIGAFASGVLLLLKVILTQFLICVVFPRLSEGEFLIKKSNDGCYILYKKFCGLWWNMDGVGGFSSISEDGAKRNLKSSLERARSGTTKIYIKVTNKQ